jgi:hypothetical protein
VTGGGSPVESVDEEQPKSRVSDVMMINMEYSVFITFTTEY